MPDTVIPTIMDIAGDHGWPGGEMPETVIEALGILAEYIGGGGSIEDGSITADKFAPGVFVVLDDDDIDDMLSQ